MGIEQIYNVFWTGGLDSTFRVSELSLCNCIIQPYYVVDNERPSSPIEINTMSRITDCIRKRKETRAQLNDLIIIDKDSIPLDDCITRSWEILRKKYAIGTQYDWLSRYAKYKNIQLEISLESSPRGKAMNAIKGEGSLIENDNEYSSYYLDPFNSSKEISEVFGNFLLPSSLWNLTKEQEVEWYKRKDLFDIAKMTWFCFTPVCGYPCGCCNPCKDALNEGMAWRIPLKGRVLGVVRKIFVRVYKKLVESLGKV